MAEPTQPTDRASQSIPPPPQDPNRAAAAQQTQATLLIRAGMTGVQEAIAHEKEHAAERAKKIQDVENQ